MLQINIKDPRSASQTPLYLDLFSTPNGVKYRNEFLMTVHSSHLHATLDPSHDVHANTVKGL